MTTERKSNFAKWTAVIAAVAGLYAFGGTLWKDYQEYDKKHKQEAIEQAFRDRDRILYRAHNEIFKDSTRNALYQDREMIHELYKKHHSKPKY